MSRSRQGLLAGLLALSLLAVAAPGEPLQVPEDYVVPHTTFEVQRVVTYPLTTYTVMPAEIGSSTFDVLLEAFDAEEGPDGTVLKLPERVLFDFGSSELRDTAADRLERLLAVLAETDDVPILVHGHTDDIGSDEANQQLSEDRAEAVADALRRGGIDGSRITTEGFGPRDPVEPNRDPDGVDDPQARQANRRVEIVVDLG